MWFGGTMRDCRKRWMEGRGMKSEREREKGRKKGKERKKRKK
jgi:hypothetical protein